MREGARADLQRGIAASMDEKEREKEWNEKETETETEAKKWEREGVEI